MSSRGYSFGTANPSISDIWLYATLKGKCIDIVLFTSYYFMNNAFNACNGMHIDILVVIL